MFFFRLFSLLLWLLLTSNFDEDILHSKQAKCHEYMAWHVTLQLVFLTSKDEKKIIIFIYYIWHYTWPYRSDAMGNGKILEGTFGESIFVVAWFMWNLLVFEWGASLNAKKSWNEIDSLFFESTRMVELITTPPAAAAAAVVIHTLNTKVVHILAVYGHSKDVIEPFLDAFVALGDVSFFSFFILSLRCYCLLLFF